MKTKSNTICPLPWHHSFINSNGNYQICCTSEEFHFGIRDEQENFLNIKNRPSLNTVINSQFMKNIRLKMLKSQWPDECKRCQQTEADCGTSRRQVENSNPQYDIESLEKLTAPDGEIKLDIKSADYRLGNLCNLECKMCGPHSSKRWIPKWNKVKPPQEHLSSYSELELKNYNWITEDYLINEFREKLPNLNHIHFAGGEPLIIPQMEKMLSICIDLGFSQNITITYNTNISYLPQSVLALWKHFKEIKLLCSIDGIGKINDYIRFPSKWREIDKNLKFLDDNFQRLNLREVLISTTVQIYNIHYLEQIYDYLKKFKNIVPAPNLINLYTPDYLSSHLIPERDKIEVARKLTSIAEDLKNVLSPEYIYLADNIYQVINFINRSSDEKLLKRFFEINEKMDIENKTSLLDFNPKLHEIESRI